MRERGRGFRHFLQLKHLLFLLRGFGRWKTISGDDLRRNSLQYGEGLLILLLELGIVQLFQNALVVCFLQGLRELFVFLLELPLPGHLR